MISIYNFIGSWQLFPEKGIYETGSRPKSGICIIAADNETKFISINTNWVTLENQAYAAQYELATDGMPHAFADADLADTVKVGIISTIHFEVFFYKNEMEVLQVVHQLLPNG